MHICNPSDPATRWGLETGEWMEACGPASLRYTGPNNKDTQPQTRWKARTNTGGCSLTPTHMCSNCLHAFTHTNSHRHTHIPHINICKIHMKDKNELLMENSWNIGYPLHGTEPFKVRVKYPQFCDSQKEHLVKRRQRHILVCA